MKNLLSNLEARRVELLELAEDVDVALGQVESAIRVAKLLEDDPLKTLATSPTRRPTSASLPKKPVTALIAQVLLEASKPVTLEQVQQKLANVDRDRINAALYRLRTSPPRAVGGKVIKTVDGLLFQKTA